MAKVLVHFAGAAAILFAVAIIIPSIVMLRRTIQGNDKDKLRVVAKQFESFGTDFKKGWNKFSDESKTLVVNMGSDIKRGLNQLSTEVQNSFHRSKRDLDLPGLIRALSVLSNDELEACYGYGVVISGLSIVFGIFQLLMGVMCCCVLSSSKRSLGVMWILGNVICLLSIVILVLVNWKYQQVCFGNVNLWFALQVIMRFDVAVVFLLTVMSFWVLPKAGGSGGGIRTQWV